MQIESLKIKGIGPYMGSVEISTAELDEIVAVTGNNGSGKTFLLECVPGALYGYFPFRMYKQSGITIYDMVTPGIDAGIEMTFRIKGKRFRIERNIEIRGEWRGNDFHETGKTQNAIIQEDVSGLWVTRAEKTKAVSEYVEREICTQQLFLASSFNSQNSAGDIVDCGSDERKQIFANIIGLGDLQLKAELFQKRALFVNTLIVKQETLRTAEQERLVDEELLKQQIGTYRQQIDNYMQERESLESSRQILLEQKAKFDSIDSDIRRYRKRSDDLSVSISSKRSEAERLEKMVKVKDGIEKYVQELVELRHSIADDEQVLDRLAEQLGGLKELDDRLADVRLESQKALTAINSELAIASNDLSTMNRGLDKARNELVQAEARQDEADILLSLDCPKNCKYVSKAVESQKWLVENPVARFEETLVRAQTRVATFSDKVKEINERIVNKEYEKPFTLQVKEIEGARKAFDPIIQECESLRAAIKASKSKVKMMEDNQVEQKMTKIELAEKQLPGLLAEIDEMQIAIDEAMDEYNKLSLNALNSPQEKIVQTQARLSQIENLVAVLNKNITENEVRLKSNVQGKVKIRIYDSMILKYQTLAGKYERLKEAFGRSGIQALVIDSEKLQFLDIARELFGILTGGKMALNFQTQKTLKSGAVREDFDLHLTVNGITRRLELCSQGQQDLGRIVMRATLGIYHSIKSGSRIQTYFMDETTGSLDETNRENYFEFLKYLLKYFKQIFVISHQDVARIIPCRIHISNDHKVTV